MFEDILFETDGPIAFTLGTVADGLAHESYLHAIC